MFLQKDALYIPGGYLPVHKYKVMTKGNKNSAFAMYENGEITQNDLRLIKFLGTVVYATMDQVGRFAEIYSTSDEAYSKQLIRLRDLLSHKVLNKCYLTDAPDVDHYPKEDRVADGNLELVCLGSAGVLLLENLQADPLLGWDYSSLLIDSGKIAEYIVATEEYLRLLKNKKTGKVILDTDVIYEMGRDCYKPTYQLTLKTDTSTSYVIGDVFHHDISDEALIKRIKGLKKFVTDKYKSQNLLEVANDAPVNVILYAADDMQMKKIARVVAGYLGHDKIKNADGTESIDDNTVAAIDFRENLRFTTASRVKKEYTDKEAFLYYNEEESRLFLITDGFQQEFYV